MRSETRETWLALGGALLLTCVLLWTVPAGIAQAIPNDLGDPLSETWLIAWYTHILTSAPSHLWDGNILYPAPATFTYQDTLLGWAPIAMPLLLVSGNVLLTYNVLFLLSYILGFWFTFLGLRVLLRAGGFRAQACAPAAFLGGIIFAFLPYKQSQMGHLHILSSQWVPLIFLCWECAWRRGGARWWCGLAACLILQALCSLYIAVFCAVALAILFVLRLLSPTGRRRVPWLPLAATAVLTGLLLLPVWIPYSQTARALGHNRTFAEIVTLAPSPRDLLHSSPTSIVYGWTDHLLPAGSRLAPQYLFPGIVPLALVLTAAWYLLHKPRPGRAEAGRQGGALPVASAWNRWQRARAVLGPYLILWPCTIILAQGPLLRLSPDAGAPALPSPYQILYHLVPGFSNFRDPGRFTIISGFCLALLAAAGLAALLDRAAIARPRRGLVSQLTARRGLIVGLTALVLLEYLAHPVAMYRVAVGAQIPPVYRWLAQHPTAQPVVELPFGRSYDLETLADYYATYHWHPVANGLSGFAPPTYRMATRVWATFPSSAGVRLLHQWAIRYVIVHGAWMPSREAQRIARQASTWRLRLVARWGTDSLYEVDLAS